MKRYSAVAISLTIIASFLTFFVVIPQPAAAAQFGRPDGDVTDGGWEDTTGGDGDGANWDEMDEVTPDDGTTFVRADNAATAMEVNLSDVTDPEVGTGHIMKFRAYATGGGPPERLTFELYQGTTQIALVNQVAITRGSWNTYTNTLSEVEANSITDYSDLRFRFTPVNLGTSDTLDVTWAELEVPDVAAGGGCQDLTATPADPSGQMWFNGTTDDVPGGLWQEENVSASFQTDATPGINVTNDDAGDNCDVTLELLSSPQTGRSMKYNTTNPAPNPGANQVPFGSNVTTCQSIAPAATCTIWLWVDYEDANGGSQAIDLRVDTIPGT